MLLKNYPYFMVVLFWVLGSYEFLASARDAVAIKSPAKDAKLVTDAKKVNFEVDPVHSSVQFKINHLGTAFSGYFKEITGSFVFDPDKLQSAAGKFVVKANSIDTRFQKRDEHLKSADFFDAEHYPEIVFVVKSLKPGNKKAKNAVKTYLLEGDLTLHGVTKVVTFNLDYTGSHIDPFSKEQKLSFSGGAKIKRADFGLKYNQIVETGGFLLGDEVELMLGIESKAIL